MENEVDNYLAWLASFTCEMYINDVSPMEIYKRLIENKTKDIEETLSLIYDKYCQKAINSKNSFCRNLKKIYLSLKEKKLDKQLCASSETMDNFDKLINEQEEYVFEKMAYPLYLFTKNLYYKLIKDGSTKVYFLSREGQYMKKMFDTFQEKIVGPKIKTEYLCVSRASTFVGTLKDIAKEDFMGLFNQYPHLSIENFCKNLAFSKEEINELANESDYNFKIKIENFKESKQFREIINNKNFQKLYDEKRKNAKRNFIGYLAQFGDDYKEKLYIVDVGWKGTIQNNIQKILPDTIINGYYLGLMNYIPIDDYSSKFPVLFEFSTIYRSPNCYLYNSNRSIFEMLLAANHGSTKSYQESPNGKYEPVLQNEELEMKMYNEKIKPIQDNLFRVFNKLLDCLNEPFYDRKEVEKKINRKFFDLIFSPSKEEVLEYKSFYHFENFGVMNYSKFNAEPKKSLLSKFKKYLRFRDFIRNDDTWQYLKLYNNNMKLGIKFVYWYKQRTFKKMDIM